MILVRDVFQARYGQGDALVALFKEARKALDAVYPHRILTDASGPFFTVITETEVENLGEWERLHAAFFRRPEADEWFARMVPLVESGRREFYNIET